MSYAVVEDLKGRLGKLEYPEIYKSDADAENDLAAAQAEIDGNLACRYETPVTDSRALPLLNDWTLTLAEERTAARPAGSQFTEKIKLRVDQVRKYLEMVRAGTFRISGAKETAAGVFSIHESEEPVMTRENLEGF